MLPIEIEEILRSYVGDDKDLEIWKWQSDEELRSSFAYLVDELFMRRIDLNIVPYGYTLLDIIYGWETSCITGGWYSIENKLDSFESITDAYKSIGLEQEANALNEAKKAWLQTGQNSEKTGLAYRSVNNEYRDEDKRFKYILNYFRKNAPDLLCV